MMNLDGLRQKAKSGDMAAQYELAEYYSNLLKETEDEDEIVRYSREAMIWLRKSAKQGYGPAVDAVKALDEDDPDDLDAAAAATAAAVASAVENYTIDFSDYPKLPDTEPLSAESDEESDEYNPYTLDAEGGRKRNGNAALACILIISLVINILVILFLIKIFRDRRLNAGSANTPSVSDTATPAPIHSPADGQSGENPGGQGSGGAGQTSAPVPSETPAVSASPTPGVTAAPSPTPGTGATPAPSGEPFWIDLDAHPELELKPDRDSLFDDYVYYIVTADNLNVRSGPDTRYAKIANFSCGDKIGAVGKYGSWYLVAVGDRLGWISGSYITGDLNWKPKPTPTPTPKPTPKPTPTPTPKPTPTPTPKPTPTPTPIPGGDSSSGDLNVW